MNEYYPVLEVPSSASTETEPLGSKPKFWFDYQNEKWLFKESRIFTGEDWAEKVASEVASLLNLSTHHVELAISDGKRGCAVKSFLNANASLVHGNELLNATIKNYDKDKQWGQSDHTFDNIVKALEKFFVKEKFLREAAYQMAGYLVFDALVGNTDRHHQNWGMVWESRGEKNGRFEFVSSLSPTFDHASSLGRELLDEKRDLRLRNNTVRQYIEKARGGIFGDTPSRYGLSPIAAARLLASKYPDFFKPWQTRVGKLSREQLLSIVERIPDERISNTGRNFVMALLSENQQLIMDIV